jgi:hypothetical protein
MKVATSIGCIRRRPFRIGGAGNAVFHAGADIPFRAYQGSKAVAPGFLSELHSLR